MYSDIHLLNIHLQKKTYANFIHESIIFRLENVLGYLLFTFALQFIEIIKKLVTFLYQMLTYV